MQFVMFSKMVQEFSVADAARQMKRIGFTGMDLTVRPEGHVLPEKVGVGLREAVQAAKDAGLSIAMISTNITSATQEHAEATAAAAVHDDIRLLKLGYWNTKAGELIEAIDRARTALDGLEKLAEKYQVTFGIHNHSGANYVNCQPAIIWTLLKDRDPRCIAAYFDAGHAAVEGSFGGWRQSLELLKPHIRMIAVKDFAMKSAPGKPKATWSRQQVPLVDGLVPWKDVFATLVDMKFEGPVSFHSEYKGNGSWRELTTPELLEQTAQDFAFIRSLLPAS